MFLLLKISLVFTISGWVTAQELKPNVEFKPDTTKFIKGKDEFILPEFIITGRETVEVSVGERVENGVVSLPMLSLRNYELAETGKPHYELISDSKRSNFQKSESRVPTAKFKVGLGRYLTTYFDGMIQGNLLKGVYLSSSFKHRASEGFIDNADFVKNNFSVESGMRLPKTNEKIFYWLDNAKLNAMFDYFTDSYGFYGSVVPSFRRNINNLEIGVSLESPFRSQFGYRFNVKYNLFALLDTLSNYGDTSFDGKEKRLDFDFNFGQRVDFLNLKFDLRYTSLVERYFSVGILAGNIFEFFDLGKAYWLDAGIKLFSFENYPKEKNFRVYPNLSFWYRFSSLTKIYALFSPEVINLTVADLIIENKYLTQNLKVVRPENYFNFIFGVNYGKGGFGLDLSLNFRAFKNFPIYVEDKQGFYLVEFEKVQFTELKLSGIFNYRRNEFTFKGVLRSSYNAKSKKPVPYFPSFSSEVGYRYVFPFGLAIVTEISLISNRVVDFDGNEIGGYVLSSLGVEYVVFKNFKVFAWFDNLLSRRYYIWKDYLEPNLIFLGGIEYKF
jgi:hypothetical protein